MDEAAVIRIVITVFGIVGTLAVTLVGIIVKRLYTSIDTLFVLIGKQEKRIKVLELAALQADPESTVLFRALTNGNGHQ